MIDTVDALEAQGIRVEQAINEYGPGQREIAVRYTGALAAADQQMKFRDTVRGVAWQHGLLASFAAKPYPDQIGSGAHVHFSLWDTAGGVTCCTTRPRTGACPGWAASSSRASREHLPALVALTAPSFNSYRPAPAQRLGVRDHGLGVRQQGSRPPRGLAVLPAGRAELQHRVQALGCAAPTPTWPSAR